ncbi:MAG: UbiH/UbiF/VisC/COQ6 family ubiquinone biosynthesis hydroxylase [Alphaproteobacteria bacterium]
MAEMIETEILVIGGGPGGLAAANALLQAGAEVVALDRVPAAVLADPAKDLRTTAISYGSRKLFEGIGLWEPLVAHGAEINQIRIVDGGSPLTMRFDCNEVGGEPFGHILENHIIRKTLFNAFVDHPRARHIDGATVTAIEPSDSYSIATLEDGRQIKARLIVGADGRGSFVRQALGIPVKRKDYPEKAMVCCVTHEKPHQDVALEHFHPTGPFASLPMQNDEQGRHRSSVVWTQKIDTADDYHALPDEEFNKELQYRYGDWLGKVEQLGGRQIWPLSISHARRYTAPRCALVADAAHGIHPIAGQGLNMGYRDVAALAELVADFRRSGLDIGAPELGRRYEKMRRLDNTSMAATTDFLVRFFSNDVTPIRMVRQLGLGVMHQIGPARRFFMRQAMGINGSSPRLLRGEAL